MLTRLLARLTVLGLLLGAYLFVPARGAWADYIHCPPNSGPCVLIATGGSSGSGGGSGSGSGSGPRTCQHSQLGGVFCYRPGLGWHNPDSECYFDRLDLLPGDPIWGGHDPGKGYMYTEYCYRDGSAGWLAERTTYLTSAPLGWGGLTSPAALAVTAVKLLGLRPPKLGLAPKPGGAGLVGLPVWMWTDTSDSHVWGTPPQARAHAPGVTVKANARSIKIVWKMGDGKTVTCYNPGRKYDPAYGQRSSPSCGHVYTRPSRNSSGAYRVTATTTWEVSWSGGGLSGTITVTRAAAAVSIRIDEMQVVTG